jgi:RHS repeat-associated protein
VSPSGLSSLLNFSGERCDAVTGHYLQGNGHRAFNPVLMRFNGPDKLSPFSRGGSNSYAYCQGDPVNFTDPTGQWIAPLVVGINVVGLVSGTAGLACAGLSVVGMKTASSPLSAAFGRKAVYWGAAAAVTGFISGVVGTARASMNASDPDNSAQNPLLIVMAALSVLSMIPTVVSVGYAFRAHKVSRAAALQKAFSGPKPAVYKNPKALQPSAPPDPVVPSTPASSPTSTRRASNSLAHDHVSRTSADPSSIDEINKNIRL